jgi:hypothetical protein
MRAARCIARLRPVVAASSRQIGACLVLPMTRGPLADRGMSSDSRAKALDSAIKQITSQFGKGAVMRLGERTVDSSVDVISTGSLTLDVALGIGGLPRG